MSKFWKDMYVSKEDTNPGIISTLPPIPFQDTEKKISLKRGISKDEYDEVCIFIRNQNRTMSGNYTLLPKNELQRYIDFGARIVTMRGGNKDSLLGTILSIPLPIKCSFDNDNTEIIKHGCTTFLNVHKILRNHGLAMALIRELIQWGYEDKLMCDYHLTPNKIGNKAIQISAWYRPIDLPKSAGLGFLYENWNTISKFNTNKVKFNTKKPSGFKIVRVLGKNSEKVLEFYKKIIADKSFVFYPDLDLFDKWIQQYPTYFVKEGKKMVGIFSISSLYCRMGDEVEGTLCFPLIFNCLLEYNISVMRCLLNVAKEREYDTLYVYQIGDVTRECLEGINAIETKDKSWFSLYNNGMNLTSENISVPLI